MVTTLEELQAESRQRPIRASDVVISELATQQISIGAVTTGATIRSAGPFIITTTNQEILALDLKSVPAGSFVSLVGEGRMDAQATIRTLAFQFRRSGLAGEALFDIRPSNSTTESVMVSLSGLDIDPLAGGKYIILCATLAGTITLRDVSFTTILHKR